MKVQNSMRLEFPSRSVNENFARAAVACFASQLDPTLSELGDLKTVVSEAVTNCIVHAYPDSIGEITLRARILENNTLEVSIRDHGCGIPDIDEARKPLFTTGGEERSGMGFTIMESFTDSMRVRSRPGHGTAVTMRKRFSAKGGEK